VSIPQFRQSLREQVGLVKMVKFRCNFCSSNSEFIWMDGYDTAEGFRVYQCLKCCAIGTKNLAESTDTQEPVIRCTKCGAWMFVDKPCHTCSLIAAK
jgi:DNA-directed RNA polymerase subunit RPC12/RpoP